MTEKVVIKITKQYEIVDAIYQPLRTDDLKPGMPEWIGRRENWHALWMIDEDDGGPYVGQWAMQPIVANHQPHPDFPYLWVPQCDLAEPV